MTMPDPYAAAPYAAPHAGTDERSAENRPSLLRAAIWVAIGALIAAAIVCVVWVLLGEQNGIVGRAFLTILLLAAFAGVTILDAHLAPRRPAWFALASMATWIAALLIGAVMIWMPEKYAWSGIPRFIQFLLIVLILQLALLHVRLYLKAFQRYDTAFTRAVAITTIVLVGALAVLLIIPLVISEWLYFYDIYWRIVVAVAILAAVGTALIPLVNALFAPKKPRASSAYPAPYPSVPAPPQQLAAHPTATPASAHVNAAPQPAVASQPSAAPQQDLLPWPNYVDGVTPLPMLPDGSPDWNAYYTGYPTPGAQVFPAPHHDPSAQQAPTAPAPPAPSGYDGYPPPPPLPPRG